MKPLLALGILTVALAGCTPPGPTQMLAENTGPSFVFERSQPAAVRDCLIPKLEQLALYPLEPFARRIPITRETQGKIQIIALDESITVYTIEIAAVGKGSRAVAAALNEAFRSKIIPTLHACGGSASIS